MVLWRWVRARVAEYRAWLAKDRVDDFDEQVRWSL